MNDSARYVPLGLFVIVSVGIAVAALGVLGWRTWLSPTLTFETYFDQSVSGLGIGAPVSFRGVPLGQVTEIVTSASLYESGVPIERRHDYIVVRGKADLSAAAADQLKRDIPALIARGLRAQTQLAGVTGQQYLELDFLDPQKYPPLPFAWKPDDIYLPSAPSVAGDIIQKAQAFLASLDDADVGRLSRNLDALVRDLDRKIDELPVSQLSKRMEEVLGEARTTLARIDALVADPSLRQTLDHAAAITARLQAISNSGELDRLIAHASDATVRLDTLLADNQADVRTIVADLRATSQNLLELSKALDRDPAGTLLGGPPPEVRLPGPTP